MTQTVLTNKLIDRSSPIPAYQQIANDISKRIAQREWKINDKLPSEQELAQNYGVSRVTIRQAMAQLERDSLIEKFQGKGAYVKINPRCLIQDLSFPSLDLAHTGENQITSRIILEEEMLPPTSEVRHMLGVQDNTILIHFLRLHYFRDRPVGLSNIWFPKEKVPEITADSLVENSISKTLFYTYHYDIEYIDNSIESMKLSVNEASLLNSIYDAPGLLINSQYLLADETPIEYSSTIWLSVCTKLHYRVTK